MAEPWAMVTSAAVALLLMLPVIRLLRAVDVMDIPNARSSHVASTPRGGGIAVMAGVAAGAAMAGPPHELWLLVASALVAAAIGLVDDMRGLSALVRLTAQFVLAAAVVAALLGPTTLTEAVVAGLALVGVVGYTNAFNFMDGVNGMSGSSGALAGAWYVYVGTGQVDAPALAAGGAVLIGACLGFLPWNLPRARVFLGDVGSYGLGLLIAGLALLAYSEGAGVGMALAPLLVYGADTGWTLVQRLRRGDSWREAHREHIYQRICDSGLSHSASTAIVGLHTVLVCVAALVLPAFVAAVAASLILVTYLILPGLLAERHQPPSVTSRR